MRHYTCARSCTLKQGAAGQGWLLRSLLCSSALFGGHARNTRSPNLFSQDGGFWDSLEYEFVTEREGQITADKYLAPRGYGHGGICMSLSCILFFFSCTGSERAGNPNCLRLFFFWEGAGNPNCFAFTAHAGPHGKSEVCVPRGD